ncbi:MAG: hypothetical protein U0324_32245 [Polyangiales bacterium]
MDLWRALVAWLARVLGRGRSAPNDVDASEPGTRDYLGFSREAVVNDPRADSWIANLRAELPFPQPLYGTAEPPANAKELHERLGALEAEVAAGVARAVAAGDGMEAGELEPDWFLALADRFLPLASWYAGVGLATGAPELPERLRDLTDKARRIPGINRALEWLGDQVEQLTRQNAGYQAAWFTLLKVHFEALLRPIAPEVEVSFDFPPPGARVAELVPPPAPGSATSGAVVRVVCPAVVVRLRKDGAERVLERGAHVRSR